jgi:signal recognition particle subunit SRP54
MGDMLTLIEKAEQVYEADEAEQAAQRLLEGTFTLDDFLDQMQQLKKMGPISGLVGMIPGMPKELKGAQIEDEQLAHIEAIIRSMTPAERADVDLIDGSRRARIAKGSGSDPGEVGQLVKQFKEMQKLMKRMPGISGTKRAKGKNKGKGKRKGGRPGGGAPGGGVQLPELPKQPFTLPGLN